MGLFHITAWGIPLIIAALAYGLNAVGYSRDMVSSGWCWISSDQPWGKMVLWLFFAGKGWEIIAYITITVFSTLVKLQIRREVRLGFIPGGDFLTSKTRDVVKKADRKLTLIPVVFILLRVWGTVRFFRFLVYHPEDPSLLKWLIVLHGIGDSSQGFANFVLFCLLTDKIRKKFRLCCVRVLPFCCTFREKDPLFESTVFPLNDTSDFSTYGARDYIIVH